MVTANSVTGSCLCGKVHFSIDSLDRDVVACHCTQCRKQTGHFVAATNTANHKLHLNGEQYLTWYCSSNEAQRGFCSRCGSVLFWRRVGSSNTSIMAGCLDAPTGLTLTRHIYVDDKGDYYSLDDGVQTFPQSD